MFAHGTEKHPTNRMPTRVCVCASMAMAHHSWIRFFIGNPACMREAAADFIDACNHERDGLKCDRDTFLLQEVLRADRDHRLVQYDKLEAWALTSAARTKLLTDWIAARQARFDRK